VAGTGVALALLARLRLHLDLQAAVPSE